MTNLAITRNFDSAAAEFDQTMCLICRCDYEPTDRIVELACKHIYHKDCLPDFYSRCPACTTPIEGRRIRKYSDDELKQLTTRVFQAAHPLVPGIRNDEDFCKENILQRIKSASERLRSQDLVPLYRILAQAFEIVASGHIPQRAIAIHADLLRKMILLNYENSDQCQLRRIQELPIGYIAVMLIHLLGSNAERAVQKAVEAGEKSLTGKPLKQYIALLQKKLSEDPEFVTEIRNRENAFAHRIERVLQQKGFREQVKYLTELDSYQNAVIFRELPEFRNAAIASKIKILASEDTFPHLIMLITIIINLSILYYNISEKHRVEEL